LASFSNNIECDVYVKIPIVYGCLCAVILVNKCSVKDVSSILKLKASIPRESDEIHTVMQSALEYLQRAIFGYTSILDLWFRPWECIPAVGHP